jgi:hypothetical protein
MSQFSLGPNSNQERSLVKTMHSMAKVSRLLIRSVKYLCAVIDHSLSSDATAMSIISKANSRYYFFCIEKNLTLHVRNFLGIA